MTFALAASADVARPRTLLRQILLAGLLAGLAWFYLVAATEHAVRVNRIKARGDQTGYLIDAKRVYANWHGQQPEYLIGERMRMPAYAGFLALAWSPRLTDDEFFEVAKRWNIRLSLVCLIVLGVAFARFLPLLPAINLTLIVAFGYFVFKAGYAQPELLSYTLFFLSFLLCCLLLETRDRARSVWLAVCAGAVGGATHLTKAVMPPFLAVYCLVFLVKEAVGWVRAGDVRSRPGVSARLLSLLVMLATFLAVVYPYIATSRRVFGDWFFNHNTSYYIWFDTGARARAIMLPHTNENGVVDMPRDQLPSMSSYLRTQSPSQILRRFTDGFTDIVVRSYTTYWYYPYVLLLLGGTVSAFVVRRQAAARVVREHLALTSFLALYAATFLLSTAFFSSISGTGTTRFLLAHMAPLLFALSYFLSRVRLGGLHLAVSALLAYDLAFTIWPRLMNTYGGF